MIPAVCKRNSWIPPKIQYREYLVSSCPSGAGHYRGGGAASRGNKKSISGTVPVALPPFGDPAPVKVSPRKPSPAPMPDPPALTFCEPLPAPGVPRFVAPGQAAYAGSGMSVPFPENTIPRRRARRNLIPVRIRAGNGVSRGISRRRQVWWAGLSGRGTKERRRQAPRATAAHNANVPEYHSRTRRRVPPHVSRDEQASPVQSPPQGTLKTRYFSVYLASMRVERFFRGFVLGVPGYLQGRHRQAPTPSTRASQSIAARLERRTSISSSKQPPSRYTENKVLFSVPCMYARELSF